LSSMGARERYLIKQNYENAQKQKYFGVITIYLETKNIYI